MSEADLVLLHMFGGAWAVNTVLITMCLVKYLRDKS